MDNSDAEKDVADSESVLKNLSNNFDELISWAELYDEASFEKKKMIVNCLIKRVEVSRGYKLKVEFNIDFEQFMVGIDKAAKQKDPGRVLGSVRVLYANSSF